MDSLDFIIIDSWNGESARVVLDGVTLYNTSFSQGGTNICGGAYLDRGPQPMLGTLAHSGNSASLTVTSTLDQPANDESWAIDNVLMMIR